MLRTLTLLALLVALPGLSRATAQETPPLERRVTLTLAGAAPEEALRQVSDISGVVLAYSSSMLDSDARVSASFADATVREALTRILGPRLRELRAEENRVVIVMRPTASAALAGDSAIGLENSVVRGERRSYKAERASGSLRLQTSILETPQVIVPVTSETIRDQQLLVVTDAARNVSGVSTVYPDYGVYTDFAFRGIRASGGRLRNGMPLSYWGALQEDMSYVESIEFIKGPAGFMLAQGEPGGMYNVVTKQPLARRHASATLTTGSYDLYRASADVGGPVTEGISYRLNMMGQKGAMHFEHSRNDRVSLAPVVRYDVTDKTSVTAEYNFDYAIVKPTLPLVPMVNGKPLPREFMVDDPDVDPSTYLHHFGLVRAEHRFSEAWKLTGQFAFSRFNPYTSQLFDAGEVDSLGFLPRFLRFYEEQNRAFGAQVFVNGDVRTGPVGHKLLIGLDAGAHRYRWYGDDTVGVFPIDVFNPEYGLGGALDGMLDKSGPWSTWDLTTWQAIAVNDYISLLSWLDVSLGGRFTRYRSRVEGIVEEDQVFTPRAGLTVRPVENVSVYALYDRAFLPQSGTDAQGERFDPMTGDNIEAGVKWEGFDRRLLLQTAIYQITKNNVLVGDPDDPDFSIQRGQVRSRGFEADAAGKVLPGLSLIANYAYTDAKVTKDSDPVVVGTREASPEHIVNAWTKYEVLSGILKGAGAGLGFTYQKNRYMFTEKRTSDDPSMMLPDLLTLDGALSYERGRWKAALNVNNLTDEFDYIGYYDYWVGDNGAYRIMTLPGVNYRLSLTYGF